MDVRSRRTLLVAAGTNWLAFAATLGVGFFLAPYLIRTLGKPRYDVWCVVESVLAYFYLLDMGVAACLVRYVARFRATGDPTGLNRVASASLAVYLAAGGLVAVVGVPVLLLLAPTLEAKTPEPADVLPFMLLMLGNMAVTLPLSVFPSVLDGLNRYPEKSAVRVVFLAVRTGAILYAVDGGLWPLAVAYTAANLAENAAMAALCWRFLPELRFRRSLVDRDMLKQVAGYSGDAFLAMIAGRITLQTGAIVIGLVMPAGAATYYATAGRLVEYAKTLLRQITTTLTPGVSAMEAKGDHAGIKRLFLAATRGVLYVVLPVNLGLWLFGRPFLGRWVGSDFVDGSFPAAAILATTVTVGVAQSVASRILYGVGKLRLFARLALVEAGLNLLLTVALIRPYGVEGVAVAVAVPNLLFCAAVLWATCVYLNVSLAEYAAAWAKPAAAAALPLAVWLSLGEPAATWPAIGFAGLAGMLPYAAAVGLAEFGHRLVRPAALPEPAVN